MKIISQKDLSKYIGKYIYAKQADGKKIRGKLVAVDGDRAYIKPIKKQGGKMVQTNWIFCLFLAGVVVLGLLAFSFVGFGGRGYGRGCGCCRRDCHRCRRKKRSHCRPRHKRRRAYA